LPEAVDLPAADDEVQHLIDRSGFQIPKGHLDQALAARTRGDWAAANSQKAYSSGSGRTKCGDGCGLVP
jgi:hypothetical protein